MSVKVRGYSMSPCAVAHAVAFIARLSTAGSGPTLAVEIEEAAAVLVMRHTATAVKARVNGFVKAILKTVCGLDSYCRRSGPDWQAEPSIMVDLCAVHLSS